MSLQARFGVARFGASRFGSIVPYLRVVIDGTERQAVVDVSTLVIDEQPDGKKKATFDVIRSIGLEEGLSVAISNCSLNSEQEFKGSIVNVKQRQKRAVEQVRYRVTCQDGTWLADRRLVYYVRDNISGTVAIRDIIATFTAGFTTNHVQTDLPVIGKLQLIGRTVTEALNEIQSLTGAGPWSWDEDNDLHFFTEEANPNPEPLAASGMTRDYEDLEIERDWSQLKTRLFIEGQGVDCPITVPAGSTNFPLEPSTPLIYTLNAAARFGPDRISFSGVTQLQPVIDVTLPFGTGGGHVQVYAAASAGDTSIQVSRDGFVQATTPGWLRVNGQYVRYTTLDFVTGFPNYIIASGIPASGYGALGIDLQVGDDLYWVDSVIGVPSSGAGSITQDMPAGTEVVIYEQADDAGAQAAVAAAEGGDGIHEYSRRDSTLTGFGCRAAAQAELAAYQASIIGITLSTRDRRARRGRVQSAAIGGDTNVTGDFFIQSARVTFRDVADPNCRSQKAFPKRAIVAKSLQQSTLRSILRNPEARR